MEKVFRITTVFVLLLIIFCCKNKEPHFIIGKWNMPVGSQVMEFIDDSTMFWAFNDNVIADTFKVKYKLDESKSPIQIDLYDFKAGILKDKMLVGILDHHSRDSIMIDFNPIENWSEADSARPKSFNLENKRLLIKVK